MEGLDIERMPFNNDNFNKMRAEIAILRDLVLKLNVAVSTKSVAAPVAAKKPVARKSK